MSTRLIVARHGNTFDKGDVLRRVGLRTDLPLSQSGLSQAQQLALHLREQYPSLAACYVSELQRTQQTAQAILGAYEAAPTMIVTSALNEVDYGEDDGQPEQAVIDRIGAQALSDWEVHDRVPEGWLINLEQIKQNWQQLTNEIVSRYQDQTVLCVTSNGIARFVDTLLAPDDDFFQDRSKKLKTAAYGELIYDTRKWSVKVWNRGMTY